MKKILLAIFLSAPLFGAPLQVEVGAESAILIDAETGRVLFAKESHEPQYPASIVKVATALLVLEAKGEVLHEMAVADRKALAAIQSSEKKKKNYRLPSHWIEFGSSHVGIKPGEELSLETLLYSLLLQSGNDAANVLAHHCAGQIPTFVEQMNSRAAALGCQNTRFTNPHGLHHPDQQTTAHDMALIAREALKYPQFQEIVQATHFEKPASNLQESVVLPQKNKLVKRGKHHYPHAIGMKTGFTQDAKGTLIAAADNGERRLIAVVLRCYPFSQAYDDVKTLFEVAFAEPKVSRELLPAGDHPFGTLAEPLTLHYYPSCPPGAVEVVLRTHLDGKQVLEVLDCRGSILLSKNI